MRICHFSDTHGNLFTLEKPSAPVDLFICTGDFFPNCYGGKHAQAGFQRRWFMSHKDPDIGEATPLEYMKEFFGTTPVLWVAGNHDWANLDELMPRSAVYRIDDGKSHDFMGRKFAGFRHVPPINGMWNGETPESEIFPIAKRAVDTGADILVTHTPPAGILADKFGSIGLLNALTYHEHRVKHHFFGHIHEHGGESAEVNGIKFYNNATTCRVIEV